MTNIIIFINNLHLNIHLDYETGREAGADGTFQIVSVTNAETEEDLSDRFDSGIHFFSEDQFMKYASEVLGRHIDFIDVAEV